MTEQIEAFECFKLNMPFTEDGRERIKDELQSSFSTSSRSTISVSGYFSISVVFRAIDLTLHGHRLLSTLYYGALLREACLSLDSRDQPFREFVYFKDKPYCCCSTIRGNILDFFGYLTLTYGSVISTYNLRLVKKCPQDNKFETNEGFCA